MSIDDADRRLMAGRKIPIHDLAAFEQPKWRGFRRSFLTTPSGLRNSQKVTGWLSKNFDIQGVGYFCKQGHTYGMPSEQKCATTQ
jgi:hypothetical protein